MKILEEQWLILISTPFYFSIIVLEILLSNYRKSDTYAVKDTLRNFMFMLLNGWLGLALRATYILVLGFFFTHSVFTWHNPVLYWICLLLAEDFCYYWLHRFDHEIRLFWAVHVTHHSSQKYNFSVGFRSSVFQPLYQFVYFIPLAIFGFKPLDIFFIYSATQIWGILAHTQLINKMGILEYFLVTPSHHRVHHASNIKYLDRNMGMFLIIWDKMFGTFQEELSEEEYEPLKFGLTKNIQETNFTESIFHEWKAMFKDAFSDGLTFRQRLGYLFHAPGWSHDGSSLTVKQMNENILNVTDFEAMDFEPQIVVE